MKIIDRMDKTLRNKNIKLVKMMWKNNDLKEATWEREDDMWKEHPYLFEGTYFKIRGRILFQVENDVIP